MINAREKARVTARTCPPLTPTPTTMSIPPNPLRRVTLPEIHSIQLPTQKIFHEEDVEIWRRTQGFRDLIIFLRRLNEAVVGITIPWSSKFPSQVRKKFLLMLLSLTYMLLRIGCIEHGNFDRYPGWLD